MKVFLINFIKYTLLVFAALWFLCAYDLITGKMRYTWSVAFLSMMMGFFCGFFEFIEQKDRRK